MCWGGECVEFVKYAMKGNYNANRKSGRVFLYCRPKVYCPATDRILLAVIAGANKYKGLKYDIRWSIKNYED